jgi:hypothetical protein
MSANLRPRCALMDKHRSRQRRLSVESLENRSLLAAVATPAAVDADSLAQAVAASSPTIAPSAPAAASGASNQAFIGNVYQELLGRAPGPSEMQNWQNYLTAYDVSPVNSQPGELGSTTTGTAVPLVESPSNNFAAATVPVGPTSGPQIGIQEFNYGPAQGVSSMNNQIGTALTTGGTNSGISGGIARSTPIPATNQASLGTTGALVGSSGQITANDPGRVALVQSVLASPEYRQRVVNEIYQNFLHRSPDSQALGYWTQQLATAGERGAIVEILASPEYFNNAGATDQGYVDALYRDLLGRSPGAQDQQYWMSQLASDGGGGSARAMVASRILSSPEATGDLVDGSATSALANLTNGGYNQLFFQGGLNAAEQQSYFTGLENNLAFEDVLASMVVGDRYFRAEAGATGPGPGNNPGMTAGRPG